MRTPSHSRHYRGGDVSTEPLPVPEAETPRFDAFALPLASPSAVTGRPSDFFTSPAVAALVLPTAFADGSFGTLAEGVAGTAGVAGVAGVAAFGISIGFAFTCVC